MAEELSEFQFDTGVSMYPWAEWLDGKIYKLTKGEDYKSQTDSFRSTAQEHARKRGKVLRTKVTENGIVIQAVDPVPVVPKK